MKKQTRLWVWGIVGIGAILIVVLSTSIFMRDNKKQITDFVITNRTELENIAFSYMSGNATIEKYKGIEVDGVYSGKHQIVQFYYSSVGIVPSTNYYGFYYSKDNVPVPFQNCEYELVSTSDDEWIWDDGTGNGGLTKKITDCWFYYEAWF